MLNSYKQAFKSKGFKLLSHCKIFKYLSKIPTLGVLNSQKILLHILLLLQCFQSCFLGKYDEVLAKKINVHYLKTIKTSIIIIHLFIPFPVTTAK